MRRMLTALLLAALALTTLAPAAPAQVAAPAQQTGDWVAKGTGGAAATVDRHATDAALEILRDGGNAIDAAVAAAATLGVVEPYSSGIGGGGFLMAYLADERRVVANDHREAAPAAFTEETFLADPATGATIPILEAVTSGLSVGVPGTVRGWNHTLRRFGTMSLREVLQPAIRVAREGFVVDETFATQTRDNLERFRDFPATARYFLDADGEVPAVGSVLRNPDLADTYEAIAERGQSAFYRGPIARDIVAAVTEPATREGIERVVRPGLMTAQDLRSYRAPFRAPSWCRYRGDTVFGMGPPSSGGPTVCLALNILEGFPLDEMSRERAFHLMFEASALAFADRGEYIGDRDYVDVPLRGLRSQAYADQRRALIGETAGTKPVEPGDPWAFEDEVGPTVATATSEEGPSTTHLTVSDADGNVVSYTFTIEQTGGSAIAVPGRGFLLNNELTDFNFAPGTANSPAGGKRPRSSMSPTIVLRDREPLLAVGSPGGSTIITTVLQILVDHLDLGATLPQAVLAPRAAQRNSPSVTAEPDFFDSPLLAPLEARGHTFALQTSPLSSNVEIGAATGIRFLSGGRVQAVAEPLRRGGGSAEVEHEGSAPAP